MSKTSSIINDLLKENTGRAMCDSGDFYGRHWQVNQKRVFHREPEHKLKFEVRGDDLEIDAVHNLYHFLKRGLEYDPTLDHQLRAFGRTKDHRNEAWLVTMEAFAEKQGWKGYRVVNTYNGEDMLSQNIQYLEYDEHVLLQVHGGCDARGGYTSARAFIQDDDWLYNNARASLSPMVSEVADVIRDLFPEVPAETPYWVTYNGGCTWEGASNLHKKLEDYPATTDPAKRKPGTIFIDGDGNGFCPITGGRLVLDYF